MTPFLKSFIKQYDEEDRSYPPPELQLCLKLDALETRLEELADKDYAYGSTYSCSDEDMKYAIPEDLCSVFDIKKAIAYVKSELTYRYGIVPEEEPILKNRR